MPSNRKDRYVDGRAAVSKAKGGTIITDFESTPKRSNNLDASNGAGIVLYCEKLPRFLSNQGQKG